MATLRRFESLIESIQFTGQLYGKTARVFNIQGRRAGFTSNTLHNDVKEFDNAVANNPVLSSSTLDIISSSVNDTNSAGTGVRQVKVVYIDSSNNLVESAAINLNGTTLVTSVLTGVNEVLWMESVTVGSGDAAAGNIRLRINGGTVECEQITVGGNRSLSARFTVPTGYTAFIPYWDAHAINADQDVRIKATVHSFDRSLSTPFHSVDCAYTALNSNIFQEIGFQKFPALCRIKVSTISSAVGLINRCDVSFVVVLVQN